MGLKITGMTKRTQFFVDYHSYARKDIEKRASKVSFFTGDWRCIEICAYPARSSPTATLLLCEVQLQIFVLLGRYFRFSSCRDFLSSSCGWAAITFFIDRKKKFWLLHSRGDASCEKVQNVASEIGGGKHSNTLEKRYLLAWSLLSGA